MGPQAAAIALAVLVLAGCAGGGGLFGGASPPPVALAGRWMLGAPNAPPCGIEIREAGGNAGPLTPDGGCPGQFYKARRWVFDDDKLIIKSEDDETLAQLENKGGRFEGTSANGMPVTLAR